MRPHFAAQGLCSHCSVCGETSIRHVQPHHVFTGQQCGNARFSFSRGPAEHQKMRQLLQHVYVANTGTRGHFAVHVLHAARASARVLRTFASASSRVAAPPERVAQSVVIVKYPALAPRVLALHDRTAKSSTSFPHDVHACAKRRTHPRRRRHDVACSSPQVFSALQRSSAQ